MEALSYLVLALPLSAMVLQLATHWRKSVAIYGCVVAVAILGLGIALGAMTADGAKSVFFYEILRIDALSAFMIIVVGSVATIAAIYGVRYITFELSHDHVTPRRAKAYGFFVPAFLFAMLLSLLANNLGVLWVSIEATTVATAFLVAHRRTDASLEAAWKYVVIGSVGVAIAFLGTVLVYFATHMVDNTTGTLSWEIAAQKAIVMNPDIARLAIALVILGFGTKVGLAPMHTWLPDAHSQAPAPVSSLMSGVLLSVAFIAILRYKVIADAALGQAFVRNMLFVLGVLSIFVAVSLLLTQRDYKRLLAYSSIEHMGIVAIGAAIGTPLAIAAVLLHIFGHALAKAVLFCASGEILIAHGSTKFADIRGIIRSQPAIGAAFGVGVAAILGLPPFALFATEIAIVFEGFRTNHWLVMSVMVSLLLVAFVAIANRAKNFLLGQSESAPVATTTPRIVVFIFFLALGTCAALGISIYPIQSLLESGAAVVTK